MKLAAILFLFFLTSVAGAAEVKIPKEIYKPVYKDPGEGDSTVGPFLMDQTPVTNQEFAIFVKSQPQFSKSQVARLLADSGYLSHWTSDTKYPSAQALFPVTNISWFVARRFCESQGKRLPTIAEWEIASDAQSPENEKQILAWYAAPGTKLRKVGIKVGNKYGVKDAHGLIWEWVDNFSEAIMSGDSRGGSPTDSLFCGGAALNAKDPKLYATFMRFAFRSSLTAVYTSANLGFRCLKEINGDHL